METEKLTARESLDIITAMIEKAKGNVQRNAFYFLLWGWVIVLANLGMYTLLRVGYERPALVWLITIPAWIYSIYYGYRREKSRATTTHFDRISTGLWLSFGVCIFTLVFFGYKINFQLNPVILLITAVPTFVSGIIIRFKPLMIGGVAFWAFGIVNFLVPMDLQFLFGAMAIVCGYLVPGYMLKNKEAQ
ncbi:MAG TPA: hypothetical protein VD816_05520 [Ohtaekwangia sp.]|nr:hypothetical protein [Ohtaekwangia sp.]